MAITDKKTLEIRNRAVEVWAEKTGIRNYTFVAQVGEHESRLNVFIDELGDLQAHVDGARKAVAEQAVKDIEHLENEAQVD